MTRNSRNGHAVLAATAAVLAAAAVVAAGTGVAGAAAAHSTARVSLGSGPAEANDGSFAPSASADGRYVAFVSNASNLVAHDINRKPDVFVRDTRTGHTTRVSVSSKGMQANDISFNPSISDDGRYVAFDSFANNLVPGDLNRKGDVFLHDMRTGTTERISRGMNGKEPNGASGFAVISGDGKHIAYESAASNIVELHDYASHLYMWDRDTRTTELISKSAAGVPGNGSSGDAAMSADGRFVAFASSAANLVPGDTNRADDVFVRDRQNGTVTRVTMTNLGIEPNGGSGSPSISDDGKVVSFESLASNLLSTDLRSLDHLHLIPDVGNAANPHTSGDTNGASDIFVRDLATGLVEMVSVNDAGEQGAASSYGATVSADGRRVAFTSYARNLDGVAAKVVGKHNEVFLRDRTAHTTTMASVDDASNAADDASNAAVISADGSAVVFSSSGTNLVSGDRNQEADIFVRR